MRKIIVHLRRARVGAFVRQAKSIVLMCLAIALVFSNQVHGLSDGDWPMFRHDASQTGLSESAAPTTQVIQLRNYTVANYPNYPSVESTPVISGEFMYVASRDAVQEIYGINCLRISTGDLIWSFQEEGVPFNSPAVDGNRVYVGSGSAWIKTEGYVYCLDALSGILIWNSSVNEPVGSPVNFADGRVFVESLAGNVHCLYAADGSEVWNFSTGGSANELCPAIADGRVFVGNENGSVFCLDAAVGTEIWNFTANGSVSDPSLAYGCVYFGSADGNAYCINASTGVKVWNYTTWFNNAGPAHNYHWGNSVGGASVAYGYVFVASSDFDLFCLDALTGQKAWNISVGAAYSYPTAVANGCIYVSSYSGTIHCLNASSGVENWSYSAGSFSPIDSGIGAPVIANGVVYVMTRQDLSGRLVPQQEFVVTMGIPQGAGSFFLAWIAAAATAALVALAGLVYLKRKKPLNRPEVKNLRFCHFPVREISSSPFEHNQKLEIELLFEFAKS